MLIQFVCISESVLGGVVAGSLTWFLCVRASKLIPNFKFPYISETSIHPKLALFMFFHSMAALAIAIFSVALVLWMSSRTMGFRPAWNPFVLGFALPIFLWNRRSPK